MAEIHEKCGDYEEALAQIETGLEYLPPDLDAKFGQEDQPNHLSNEIDLRVELAHLYLIRSRLSEHQEDFDRAIQWSQHSLTIATPIETCQGQQMTAQVYINLSRICCHQSDFAASIGFSQESIQRYQQLEDQVGLAQAYDCLGDIYTAQGDWPQAIEAYGRSLEINQDVGNIYEQLVGA